MALIPPFFLDCVVAIGIDDNEGKRQWIASGFLYGHFLSKIDETTHRYSVYLVTNRHVLDGQTVVYLRFNPKEGTPAREYTLDFTTAHSSNHPDLDIDLAIVQINPNVLKKDGIQFSYFYSDSVIADKKMLGDLGVTEGDFGYVLGFPLGLVGEQRSYVVARHGSIARIRDYLAGERPSRWPRSATATPSSSGTRSPQPSCRGTRPSSTCSSKGAGGAPESSSEFTPGGCPRRYRTQPIRNRLGAQKRKCPPILASEQWAKLPEVVD